MTFKIDNTFNSVAEFLGYLQGEKPGWRRENMSTINDKPDSFNGSVTYDQAMLLAEFGWPEGRSLMSDVTATMDLNEIKVETAETLMLDVAGAYPNVALACAGDPCHMIDIQPTEVPHRIIKIVATVSFRGGMNADAIITHGAAVLSYIDALETAGWRCEVWGRSLAKDYDDNSCALSVCLKQAQDHLDIDKMAFALAHPAFTRRLIFRYRETFAETQRTFAYGYGRTCDDNPGDCDVFLPRIDDNALADNDRALAHVGSHLDKTLKGEAA